MTAVSIPDPRDLEKAFTALAPGSTLMYWSGRSLVELCWDEERGHKEKAYVTQAVKARALRDWAASKQHRGTGFLTQKRFGPVYDYRLTKAKETKR